MFTHNFIYSLKVLLKNKMLIFWTFAFPILLGIFFNMAFSDIEKNEKLDIINIAIIDSESSDNVFKETFKKFNDETQMFNINYTNLEDAKKLLENKKIDELKLTYFYKKIILLSPLVLLKPQFLQI